MPRLHMQVWQPGTEKKASKKDFVVVKLVQYFVRKVDRMPVHTESKKFEF